MGKAKKVAARVEGVTLRATGRPFSGVGGSHRVGGGASRAGAGPGGRRCGEVPPLGEASPSRRGRAFMTLVLCRSDYENYQQ